MRAQSSIYPTRRICSLVQAVVLALCIASTAVGIPGQTIGTASSPLSLPADVAFDALGNLFFSDTNQHIVRRLNTGGTLLIVAGSGVQGFAGDGGPATAAELDSPAGLALDAAGDLYIADTHNHRVRRVDAGTGLISTVAGTGVAGFAGDGGAATTARLNLPTALAVDGAGNLYIADTNNHRVRKVAAATTGAISTVAGDGSQLFSGDGGAPTAAGIDSPTGIAVDGAGDVYVSDTHNQRLRVVSAATRTISTVAGTGAAGFSGDGAVGTGARLALPHGVSVDGVGNVFVADTNNHRVRKIAPDGTISTVAGDGVQAFLGDGGPAVAAGLNSPRGVAVSPGGLTTLADTGNQRVRQVEANATIVTLAGTGSLAGQTLILSGPASVVYGTGSLTATLAGGGSASGNVTFFDSGASGAAALSSTPLSGGVAVLDTGTLGAGAHQIYASYAGDANHAPATSGTVALAVAPAPASATVGSVTLLYGQAVPGLTGTLQGVLARDAAAVTLQLSSAAGALSPAGSYPVTAVLSGAADMDYVLAPLNAAVTIAKAGSVASLNDGIVSAAASGAPVTLAAHIASTTAGVPTGTVTMMDGGSALATVPLSGTGDALYTTSSLAAGVHSLTGVYGGDRNFVGSTTAVQTIAVANPPVVDFTIAAVGAASQTVPAGTPASFNFAVQESGGTLSSPITLAVAGLPVGTTGSFNPGTLVPGGGTAFQLTVQTAKTLIAKRSGGSVAWTGGVAWAVLLLPWMPFGRRRLAGAALCMVGLLALTGCGANMTAVAPATQSYSITVSGTATSATGTLLEHTATVTLTVQ